MKTAAGTTTAVLILLMLGVGLHASPPGAVYVNYIEGRVEHVAANSVRGVPAKANRAIAEGESLVVAPPGNAELFIRDGSVLRIGGGSRLKVLSVERGAVHFLLERGKVHVNFTGLKGYPLFFSTPSAEVDVLDRSTFRMDIGETGETEVSVLAGELYVAQPKGRMKIIVGTRLVMRKDGKAPVYTRTGLRTTGTNGTGRGMGRQSFPRAAGANPGSRQWMRCRQAPTRVRQRSRPLPRRSRHRSLPTSTSMSGWVRHGAIPGIPIPTRTDPMCGAIGVPGIPDGTGTALPAVTGGTAALPRAVIGVNPLNILKE
jgi:hypothetical protein